MPAYHIHITGLVQGVGFRPWVHQLAAAMNLDGWVSNGADGVHIYCASDATPVQDFYKKILAHPPVQSIITAHYLEQVEDLQIDKGFQIKASSESASIGMLLTPDIALCDECRRELNHPANKRFHYPFITCVNCGPRYSIAKAIPYDRKIPRCGICRNAKVACPNIRI